jgi:TolA-binding protein
MKKFILFFLISILSIDLLQADENEDAQSDLLFLKIQELEIEIAYLRNQIESQEYLINKLIDESVDSKSEASDDGVANLPIDSNLRFKGIEDSKSKDDIYKSAINALEEQNFDKALLLFKYFVESFTDEEKTPLSFFWLGEISLIQNNFEQSNNYFMELISSFPSHYRIPLAHKKIGDIYLKTNDVAMAKEKYNYVVREYPDNTASSLALQLLKNME